VGFENAWPFLDRIRGEGFDSAGIGAGKGIEMNIRENQEGTFIPSGRNYPVLESLSRIRAERDRMEAQKPTGKKEEGLLR
jgi:hypothetical protein